MIDSSVCNTLGALANAEYAIMQQLNAKFISLERLAAFLYELGTLGIQLPDISGLVSLSAITPAVYAQLNISCPALGLPPPTVGLGPMQAAVGASYALLGKRLQLHPWNRLLKLQRQLDEFIADVNAGAALGYNVLLCLENACYAAASGNLVVIGLAGATSADIYSQVSTYHTNFITNGGQILTPTMQASANKVAGMVTALSGLVDVHNVTVPLNTNLPSVNYASYTH